MNPEFKSQFNIYFQKFINEKKKLQGINMKLNVEFLYDLMIISLQIILLQSIRII